MASIHKRKNSWRITIRRRGIPEQTPLGRLGQPEDIAGVIAGLCAGASAWINGQNIFANGGMS